MNNLNVTQLGIAKIASRAEIIVLELICRGKETVKGFSDAFHALAKDDQARRRLQNLGVEPVFSDSETFSRFIHEEQPKWDALVSQIPSARN